MESITNISFAGRKVLLRVDFNVPMDANFNITDDTRMVEAMPTIQKLLGDGAALIIMSHLGRPKGEPDPQFSLQPVARHLEKMLHRPVLFTTNLLGDEVTRMAKGLKSGEIMLLENIRFYAGETKGDEALAQELAKLGDCYVNDAFGAAHREHSSTAVIAKYFPHDKYFGILMENEVKNLKSIIEHPQHPFTAIIGGSKVSSKIGILKNLMNLADNIIIVGGMRFPFCKAKGGRIGMSMCENDKIEDARALMDEMDRRGIKYYFPLDSMVADEFSEHSHKQLVDADDIPDGWTALDCGPRSTALFHQLIMDSKMVIWNGPAGMFELPSFSRGTRELALSCAAACQNGTYVAIGGGDSVAAIQQARLASHISYISTGGGAMLEYLEGKPLPGIAAIED